MGNRINLEIIDKCKSEISTNSVRVNAIGFFFGCQLSFPHHYHSVVVVVVFSRSPRRQFRAIFEKKKKDKKFELKTSIVAVAESGLPPCASMCAAWTFGNAGIGPRVPKVMW